ncbi:1-acyl-sn-glycerol-3-phosphate acyltransferase [Frankia sp. QA3]|uniref:1-acyl-sn-glycerol-3-phosphate acyltransferase n=1 Tax=Frankia sp. QA3 TaxID=710111 RepID=UPI000269C610|nr:1-acyl-sn-glycerol-3-phosphate acyltransferase [Frankia sp. QA3]EIV94432.1 1-acyl-sn-glycerol-3-phosphate acyltransferase [Frankia sp. QA3]
MGVPPWAVRRFLLDPLFVPLAAALALVGVAVAALGLLGAPVDRRLRLSRAALLAAAYLTVEVILIVAAFGLWLARPALRRRWEAAHVWLVRRALERLVAAARLLVGLRVEITEPPRDGAGAGGRPVLVLSRHAGPGDSFVLIHLLLSRYRLLPRVVLVHQLQLDPAIDILLGRLGACFLRNDGSDDHAAARIGELARGLGAGEALVIFPEGANFTPSRRLRLIARLRAGGQWDRAAVAEDLDAVLPPRPAGVLAALATGRIAATMIVAHAGLDEFSAPGEVWRALPFAAPLLLRWWWVPAAEIPDPERARRQWLTMHWAVVNAWIGAQRALGTSQPPAGGSVPPTDPVNPVV